MYHVNVEAAPGGLRALAWTRTRRGGRGHRASKRAANGAQAGVGPFQCVAVDVASDAAETVPHTLQRRVMSAPVAAALLAQGWTGSLTRGRTRGTGRSHSVAIRSCLMTPRIIRPTRPHHTTLHYGAIPALFYPQKSVRRDLTDIRVDK